MTPLRFALDVRVGCLTERNTMLSRLEKTLWPSPNAGPG
jgi:hypothetical protein